MGPNQDWYCKRATSDQEKWLNWTSKVLARFQYYNGLVNRLEATPLNISLDNLDIASMGPNRDRYCK